MKKLVAIILVLALSITLFAACGEKGPVVTPEVGGEVEQPAVDPAPEVDPVDEPVDEPATGIRTGIAVVTSISSSKDAADGADGLGQTDATVAAVLIDENDVIIDVAIDTAQSKINFNAEGKLTTDMSTIFLTKYELGEGYNMRAGSPIRKEWFEQASALEAYVIGKTVSEVSGIALDEGYPTDADLTASVTINVNSYISAIAKAAANAKVLGANVGDKIGIGTVTDMGQSKDAAADADGLAQAYSSFVAVTVDATGTISSVAIDSVQGNVSFDATGKVTVADLAAPVQSKQELGEGYNMKAASPIGKEWFEQADAFAAYLTGKNVADIAGIALTDGAPADADLAASVTIGVTNINSAVVKAVANALLAPADIAAMVVEEPVETPAETEATDSIEGVAELPAA